MNTHRRSRRSLRLGAILVPAALASAPGCHLFDDLKPTGGYLTYDQAARLCARLFDCPTRLGADFARSVMESTGIPAEATSFSACMSWYAGPVSERPSGVDAQRQILSALAEASSCEAANDLLVLRYLPGTGPGATGGGESGASGDLCAGKTADACTDDNTTVVDCKERRLVHCADEQVFEQGSTCGRQSQFSAWCQATACGTDLDKVLSVPVPTCAGDSLLRICDTTVKTEMHVRCDAIGLTCLKARVGGVKMGICSNHISSEVSDLDRASACNDATTKCQFGGSSVVVCSGSTQLPGLGGLITKNVFTAYESVFDCKAIDFQCHDGGTATSHPYCFRSDADACSPEDYADARCNGDELPVCLSGRRTTVDCAAAGLRCRDKAAGSSMSAHCAYPE